jgi:hypothetical protein
MQNDAEERFSLPVQSNTDARRNPAPHHTPGICGASLIDADIGANYAANHVACDPDSA